MLQIKDSVAVITGASGGIGYVLAKMWLELGGKAVLADLNSEQLEKAEKALSAIGPVASLVVDVTSEDDNSKLAQFAIDTFGAINFVAPFAGIIKDGMMVSPDRETGKVTSKMSLADFKQVVDINLTGVFLTIRECSEAMINNGDKGAICLISSTGSLGTAGQINYSSTKAAMSVIPKVLTGEFMRRGLGGQIRVVAVAPGYVGTAMVKNMNQKALDGIVGQVPIGRLIEPEEVAQLAMDLFKNEAIAGETFFIHGGLRLGSKG